MAFIKGYKQSEEHKKKLDPTRHKFKKGQPSWNKGIPMSDSAKIKLGNAFRGKKHTKERCEKMSAGIKKALSSPEMRLKKSLLQKGEKGSNWRGGITPLNHTIRTSSLYKQWRDAVFKRDNYTCVTCNKYSGKLNADHIKPFSTHPELRLDINNGRTLCEYCHRKTPTWGRPRVEKLLDNNFTK